MPHIPARSGKTFIGHHGGGLADRRRHRAFDPVTRILLRLCGGKAGIGSLDDLDLAFRSGPSFRSTREERLQLAHHLGSFP